MTNNPSYICNNDRKNITAAAAFLRKDDGDSMEEFEKDLNENEDITENRHDHPKEQVTDSDTAENTDAQVSETAENLPVSAETQEVSVSEDGQRPVYRWNYEEQTAFSKEKTKDKRRRSAIIYAAVTTGVFMVAFTVLVALLIFNRFKFVADNPNVTGDTPQNTVISDRVVYVREYDSESGVLTTQEIYNKCLPSVVSISVSSSSSAAIGSGFIISEDGYIVTANHVIQDMTRIRVVLSNEESYEATVIDGNEFTDLALIKIEKTGLTPIKIGKSSDLLVGDNVVAIGTPASIDFAGSLAEGNVSYNDRILKVYGSDGSVEKKMTLIQTNALVNPGNSGCPLINEYGEAVGVVTMKLNSTYYEGMCFAIPTDAAMPIINAMKNGENYDSLLSAVSRYPAMLGITAQNVVMDNGIYGVRIDTFASSQYDISSKMKLNDIIVAINSNPVSTVEDIGRVLNKCNPGDTVSITFYRETQKMTVNVVLST